MKLADVIPSHKLNLATKNFRDSLDALRLQIDWDAQAGESWARAFEAQELIALVHRFVPVAFSKRNIPLAHWKKILVDDFDEPMIEDDASALANIFNCEMSTISTPCSPNDLWFHSV